MKNLRNFFQTAILLTVFVLTSSTAFGTLTFSGSNWIGLNSNSTYIFVASDTDVNVTIYPDVDFMMVNGSATVETTIAANHSIYLPITIDRTTMTNDYYMVNINFDTGSGIVKHPIFIQSGVAGEGYTFFRSHFNEFEAGTLYRNVDQAWSEQFDSVIVEEDGEKFLRMETEYTYSYLWLTCNTINGISDSYNHKISFKCFVPSELPGSWLTFTIIENGTDIFNVYLNKRDYGQKGVFLCKSQDEYPQCLLVDKICQPDEWIDVSFTFNFNSADPRLVCATFGGITTNVNLQINAPGDGNDNFNTLRYLSPSDVPLSFKDVVVEAEPIRLNVKQSEHGNITVTPYKDFYDRNEVVTIIATPEEGYKLNGLYCDDFQTVSLTNIYTVTHETFVRAEFVPLNILFSENFEDYAIGTKIIGNVEGWSSYTECQEAVTVAQDEDSHVMKFDLSGEVDFAEVYSPSFKTQGDNPYRELTKFSFRFKVSSGYFVFWLLDNYDCTAFAVDIDVEYNYGMAYTVNWSEGGWADELGLNNFYTNKYNELSCTYDPLENKIIEICLNGETNSCSMTIGSPMENTRFYYECSSDAGDCFVDDIKAEVIYRYPTPTIYTPDIEYIPIGKSDLRTAIHNGGPTAEISYTVSCDADWLTISPTSGTFTERAEIYYQANANKPLGCYEANVTFDGGEYGSRTMKVIWQNGFIYQSHFDELDLGDIISQDSRWSHRNVLYSDNENYEIVSGGCGSNAHCLKINQQNSYGEGAFLHLANLPQGTNVKVRISFDFKADDASTSFSFGDTGYQLSFSAYVNNSYVSCSPPVTDTVVCYGNHIGEWVHLTYTANISDEEWVLLFTQVNDIVVSNELEIAIARVPEEARGFFLNCQRNKSFYVDNLSYEIVYDEVGVDCADPVGGSLSISPVKEAYYKGDVITITATPDPGYELQSVFCDDFSSTNLVSSYKLTHPVFFLATFVPRKYRLSLGTTAGGSVTVSPEKANYSYNESVTLTAVPDSGYDFYCYTGTVYSTSQTTVITMDQHHDILAKFKKDNYRLNLTQGDNGTVTVSPQKETYAYNEKVTLTATPDDGYAFGGFSGTASSTNQTMVITMDQDHDITASFFYDSYTLDLTVGEHGNVTVSPEKDIYHYNEKVTLTAIPDDDYAFSGFTGTASTSETTMKITMDQDHVIAAGFYFDAYRLNVSVVSHGSVTKNPDKEKYHLNETVTLTAVPDEYYEFQGFTGTASSEALSMTVTMDQDHDIVATFYSDLVPDNDDVVNAAPMTIGTEVSGNNQYATLEEGEVESVPDLFNNGWQHSLWYKFNLGQTDPQNVTINVSAVEGSEFDAAIVIATGTGFADFNYVVVQDTGTDETFTEVLEGNVDYYLGVYSWNEDTYGDFVITSSSVPIKDWYCSPDGTGSGDSFEDPCDLKTAIANVTSGKTVFMAPGTYSLTKEGTVENIRWSEANFLAIKNDNVSVIGSGSDQTIIYCERTTDVGVVLMAPGILLKGVQIEHPFMNGDVTWGGSFYGMHAALNVMDSATIEDVLVHLGDQGSASEEDQLSLLRPITIQCNPAVVNIKNSAFISEGVLGACGVRPFTWNSSVPQLTTVNFDFCTFRNGRNVNAAIYGTTWYGNQLLDVNVNDCVFLNGGSPVGESGDQGERSWNFNVSRCFMPGAWLGTNTFATVTYTDCDNVIDPQVDANWHSPLVKAGFKNSIPMGVYATVLDEDFSSYEEGDVKGRYGWSDNFGSNGEIVAVKDGDNTYLEIKPTGFWGARYDFENPVEAGWAEADNPYSSWLISARMKLSETDSFLNVFIARPETGSFEFRREGDHYRFYPGDEMPISNLEIPIDTWFDFSIEFIANVVDATRVVKAISVDGVREELNEGEEISEYTDIFSALRFFFAQDGMTLSFDSLKIEYLKDIPPNDYFSRALVYDESGAINGNNEEARIEAGEDPDSRNTVWYSFDSDDNGAVTFTTAGSWADYANDTMLAVYSADTATPTIRELTEVVPPTNEGRDEAVTFTKRPGKYYFISVGSAEGAGEFILSHEWIGNYTLDITSDGHGEVTVSPQKETYHLYEEVTLTATPSTDYVFENYSGTISSTNSITVISMEQDHDINANFHLDAYYLYLTTGDGGFVTVSPEKEVYHWKEIVTLTATPDPDYGFDGYTGTSSSTNLTMEITMEEDQVITAEFYFDAYRLNLEAGPNGSITVSPEKETYHRNEVVILTATPDEDYAFTGYTGTAFSDDPVMEIVMDQDHDIAGGFYFDAYTLTLNKGSHGTVAVIPEKEKYHFNEVVKLIAIPDDEYAFSGFTGTESSTNLVMEIVMNQHQIIAARFYFDAYSLSLSIGANGDVLVSPNKETYHLNEKVILTATPDDEYAFAGFTGTASSTNQVMEIVMNQHHSIKTSFYFDAYRLNLDVGSNGSVEVSPEKETYHMNEIVTLTATPNAEYAFEGYTGTAESTNLVMEIVMNQHHDIDAEFYFDAYRIDLKTTAGGSVAVNPEKETYHRNEVVTLTATPDAEYAFEGYTGTAESTNLVMQITMNQHYDIAAEFYFDAYRINLEVGPNGNVAVSPEKETYHRNEVVTLTATPDAEYAFEGYTGTASSTNTVMQITMNQHYDIAAEFYFDAYRINLEVGPNGSVAVSPEKETYHRNEVVTLTATPDAEYAFEGYTGTAESTNLVMQITMNQHYDIAAEFYFDAYRINLEVGPNGTVAVSPEKETYHRNEVVSLKATPDAEYAFEGYTGTVSSTNTVMEIVMNQHYDIAAEFYFDAYRINLEVGPNGTVAVSPEKETYHRNEVVTLTATPDAEYAFEGYTGTAESTNLVMQITMNQHYDIAAEFYFDAYRINLEVGPNGTVAVSPEKETYHRNEVVSLKATPDAEYAFEGYTGTVSSTNTVMEIVMNQHYDIAAEFYFDAYRINLEVGSNGSVAVSPEKETYHRNEVVTLTATPDAEYAFEGYTGTASSTNTVMEIVMNQHYDIAAEFYFDAYKLNLTVGDNGAVAVVPEKETYHRDEKVTLTATPDAEYAFSGYTGTAESTNLVMEITMNQHHEIAAEFYFDAYRLQVTAGDGGSVVYEPVKDTYHNEEEVTITATPEVGYSFANYTGTAESEENPLVIKMTQHHEITANFTNLEYVVTCETVVGGSVTLSPQKSSYHYNDEITYTVEPDNGYHFIELQGYEEVLTNLTGTIVVTEAYTLTPVFELDEYSVTFSSTFGGTIELEPSQETYHYNDVVMVKDTPDEGYILSKIIANGEELESSSYTITGDAEIKAVFVYGDEKPSGEGTENSPYEIANVANLVWLSRNTQTESGAYSVLTADIDLTICTNWMDGLGFEPIGSLEAPFQGSFDGADFTIKGLYINDPELEGAGLFGYVEDSNIKNLNIIEAEVVCAKNAGLLAGSMSNSSVEKIAVSGGVSAETNSALLIGYADSTSIELASTEGHAEGNENVGGMVGLAKESEIKNAYTVAIVSGQNNVGGFVGNADGDTVSYGYAAGSVNCEGAQGGIFGADGQSEVISTFFDKALAKDNGYGNPVTAEDLLNRETYEDWDFDEIWDIDDGVGTPYFRYAVPEPFGVFALLLLSCFLLKRD